MVPRQIAFQDHTGAPSGLRFRAQCATDLLNAAPKTPTDTPPAAAIDVERDTPVLQTTYLLIHQILHASVLVCAAHSSTCSVFHSLCVGTILVMRSRVPPFSGVFVSWPLLRS